MVLRRFLILVGFSTAPPALTIVLIRASSMRKSASLLALSSMDSALISFTRIILLSPQVLFLQQVLVRQLLLLLALLVLALLQVSARLVLLVLGEFGLLEQLLVLLRVLV